MKEGTRGLLANVAWAAFVIGLIGLLIAAFVAAVLPIGERNVREGTVLTADCSAGWYQHPVVVLNTSAGVWSFSPSRGDCIALSTAIGLEVVVVTDGFGLVVEWWIK